MYCAHVFTLFLTRLPNGNGGCGRPSCGQSSIDRAGTLGGLVDDYLGTDRIKKDNVIRKYGLIENWDVSQVSNMMNVLIQRVDSGKNMNMVLR